MNLQSLLEHYGYVAVLLGTFAEGESMLLLGSYAAHRGFVHLPGMRIALPLAVGMSGMSTSRFLLLNLISAGAWALLLGWLGYAASQLLATLAADVHRHEQLIAGVLAAAAVAILAWRWLRIGPVVEP